MLLPAKVTRTSTASPRTALVTRTTSESGEPGRLDQISQIFARLSEMEILVSQTGDSSTVGQPVRISALASMTRKYRVCWGPLQTHKEHNVQTESLI